LLDRAGDQEIFKCYDLRTGKGLWDYAYKLEGEFMREGSRTVPAIDGDYAYTCGCLGDLLCIDLNTRKPAWEHHFWGQYPRGGGPPWGIAQNPLIHEDLVIIAPQTATAGVVAFDKRSGQVRWASKPLGDFGYANPSLVRIDGELQLAMVAARGNWQIGESVAPYQGIVGLDLETGKILWRYKKWECVIPIPYVVDAGQNRLFISAGYRNGCALFQVNKVEQEYVAEEIYQKMAFESHIHAPLVHDGHFYAQCTGKGRQDGMTCWSIDGELKWKTGKNPQFDKGGMLLVDGMIITVDGKHGKLYLLGATPDRFAVLSEAQMLNRSMCWAPLAFSRGKLIIRDQRQMKCLVLK
jgi:outer membrane protein assembly factor BamB